MTKKSKEKTGFFEAVQEDGMSNFTWGPMMWFYHYVKVKGFSHYERHTFMHLFGARVGHWKCAQISGGVLGVDTVQKMWKMPEWYPHWAHSIYKKYRLRRFRKGIK